MRLFGQFGEKPVHSHVEGPRLLGVGQMAGLLNHLKTRAGDEASQRIRKRRRRDAVLVAAQDQSGYADRCRRNTQIGEPDGFSANAVGDRIA